MTFPTWGEAWAAVRRSGDPMLLLLTVWHDEIGIYRFVRDGADFTSRGEVFKAAWFEVGFINDDGNLPRSTLTFPNVDPEIGQKLLRLSTRPKVTIEGVAVSMPDEPLAAARSLDLRGIRVSDTAISGDLVGVDHSTEPVGTIVVLPSNFPALFRRARKS